MFYMKLDQTAVDYSRIMLCQKEAGIIKESGGKIQPGDIYVVGGPTHLKHKALDEININLIDFQPMVLIFDQISPKEEKFSKMLSLKDAMENISIDEIKSQYSSDGSTRYEQAYYATVFLNHDYTKSYTMKIKGYSYFYTKSLGKVLNNFIAKCLQEDRNIYSYTFNVKTSNTINKKNKILYFYEVNSVKNKALDPQYILAIEDFYNYRFANQPEDLELALKILKALPNVKEQSQSLSEKTETPRKESKPVNRDVTHFVDAKDISNIAELNKAFADSLISPEDFQKRYKELTEKEKATEIEKENTSFDDIPF